MDLPNKSSLIDVSFPRKRESHDARRIPACAGMTVVIILLLLMSLTASAKKKVVDAEQDSGWNRVPAADEAGTFYRNGTLPGGLHVEYSIVTLGRYKKDASSVFDYTFAETSAIAEHFNNNSASSDLAQVAAAAGTAPVKVSKATLVLAKHAREISEWTEGGFDAVRGPGSYKNLKIDEKNSTLYLKKKGLTIDLSGILEGFIADLFIRAAYHAKLSDAFVSVNGTFRSLGSNYFGPWQLQLSGAGDKTALKGMTISLSDYAAATVGGKYPAPETNPRSGKPINNELYSVTVLAKQAATAEAVATSIYVDGERAGINLINGLGIRGIFAYKDGSFKKIGKWD